MHENATLDRIPDSCPHKKNLVKFAENIRKVVEEGKNLLIWGDFGFGKSASAAILLKAALSKGIFGFWTTYDEYIGACIKGVYYDDNISYEDRCKEVPLLVIDELILRDEAKQKETMFEILVRSRLEHKRSTIITTNHSVGWMGHNHKSLNSLFNGHFYIMEPKGFNFRQGK